MSTLHLRPTHPSLWWYAAGACLAGILLTVVLGTFHGGTSAPTAPAITSSPSVASGAGHAWRDVPLCFAMPRGSNPELARPACDVQSP